MNHPHNPPHKNSSKNQAKQPHPTSKDALDSSLPARVYTTPKSPASENNPRRSYTPDVPARYPHYRNHAMEHLRPHLSLQEVLGARVQDFSWSPKQLIIGAKSITTPSTVEVFESFLEVRSELTKALPALAQPDAYLFPALDGGNLFVSHRPQGMLNKGHKQFVESRDALFSFLFTTAQDKSIEYFLTMTMQHVKGHTMNFRHNPLLAREYQSLLTRYLENRESWCKQVKELWKILDSHGSRTKPSKLNSTIKRLYAEESPSREQRVQLRELCKVKEDLDAHREARIERQTLARERSRPGYSASVEVNEEYDPLDEEMITPSIMPVYCPNSMLIFLGTDGGKIFGDV
jgi:hypothetical protein